MFVRYALRRVLFLIPVLFGISVFVFSLAHFAPGDPVRNLLGSVYTPERAAELRHQLRLDEPLPIQYIDWVGDALRGNLGQSIILHRSVGGIIIQRLPTTLTLAVVSTILATLVAVPLGVLAAIYRDSWIDNLARVLAILAASMPVFWLGILMLMLFAVRLHWFPASGDVSQHGWKALVLPSIALGAFLGALITRMVRSTMLDVLGEEYIRTARAKGLGSGAVYLRHALRNALIPVITVIGLEFGAVLGGAVVTETIFNIAGLGRLLITAVDSRDYPLIQGTVLITSFAFVFVNLIVDLLYMAIDPRIRFR